MTTEQLTNIFITFFRDEIIPPLPPHQNVPRITNRKRFRSIGYKYYRFKKLNSFYDPRASDLTAKTLGEDGKWRKIERNEPCPCKAKNKDGTPIKYKHCCGQSN